MTRIKEITRRVTRAARKNWTDWHRQEFDDHSVADIQYLLALVEEKDREIAELTDASVTDRREYP